MKISKKNNPSSTPVVVVGVGASTGGLETISALLETMPADAGIALVLVQHLMSNHPSMSAELFSSHTAMPVQEVVQGAALLPNHIYTAPPDQYVGLRNGCFELTPEPKHKSLQYPINHFFKSLASEYGARAIGIVLSGHGKDGTLGIEYLSEHNALVLVQDPDTALVDTMPRNALATGLVDDVLMVKDIPKAISEYLSAIQNTPAYPLGRLPPGVLQDAEMTSPSLVNDSKEIQNIFKILLAQRGYDFSGYKRKTLLRRIGRRMVQHALARESEYVKLLKKDVQEVDALFFDLLIGVTEFFRDPQAWDVLDSEVIKSIVTNKKKNETIRIWVPGCSTGEEAYSLAMLVLDRMRRSRKHCAVKIFATDTNPQALDVGRAGQYPLNIATRISAQRLKRYFQLAADQQHYVVSEELRSSVVFGNQNLFSDPPFGRVDLISCRNVLIYLDSEVQKNVINTFHFALRSDGYLFLGNAESHAGRDDLFKPLSQFGRIYQRIGSARFQAVTLPVTPADSRPLKLIPKSADTPAAIAAHVAQKLILERFSPAAVLVNNDFQALHFCGPTDEFLLRPAGAPTQDLLMMVREGLRSRLHTGLLEAIDKENTVVVSGAMMKQGEWFRSVEMTITPAHAAAQITQPSGFRSGLLVVFRFEPQQQSAVDQTGANNVLVRHLEQELQITLEDLAATTERFEETNESLRVSNELVLTSNEALRALNEELESSKEELQSFNEEITTVNQQLQSKIRELETSHNDIQNLLTSSDIATLCLDSALRIKWFAPAAQRLFGLSVSNIGHALNGVVMAVGDTQLLLLARSVLAGQVVRDAELATPNGRCYIRRILPYKNMDQKIQGVILTYTDITDSYQVAQTALTAQRDLDETRERADRLRILSAALANAEERERRALAKDLHDDLGQLLAVIGLKVSILQKQDMPDDVRALVVECANAVQFANNKMRDITMQLNPPMLDQLGLIPALHWLSDEMHRLYKLDVVIKDDGMPKPMEPAVSATLFRALRELLLNVTKHAQVPEAEISTEQGKDNSLLVKVNDTGGGLDPAIIDPLISSRATGLVSIRERIGYLGGEMSIVSNPGVGTTVVLKVPLLDNNGTDDVTTPKESP